MVFDPYSMARKRYRMKKTLRVAALVLLTVCVFFVAVLLFSVVESALPLRLPSGLVTFPAAIAACAGFLMMVERWWIRWLVPPAPTGCPQCGYPVNDKPDGRCSECGVDLTPPTRWKD